MDYNPEFPFPPKGSEPQSEDGGGDQRDDSNDGSDSTLTKGNSSGGLGGQSASELLGSRKCKLRKREERVRVGKREKKEKGKKEKKQEIVKEGEGEEGKEFQMMVLGENFEGFDNFEALHDCSEEGEGTEDGEEEKMEGNLTRSQEGPPKENLRARMKKQRTLDDRSVGSSQLLRMKSAGSGLILEKSAGSGLTLETSLIFSFFPHFPPSFFIDCPGSSKVTSKITKSVHLRKEEAMEDGAKPLALCVLFEEIWVSLHTGAIRVFDLGIKLIATVFQFAFFFSCSPPILFCPLPEFYSDPFISDTPLELM